VTGTSMGSIVGALYATGISAEQLAARAVRKSTICTELSAIDMALARPGLLAGKRMRKILWDLGLRERFEDLALPFQAMATDIESGEQVPIGTGELAAACRASASIPAVFDAMGGSWWTVGWWSRCRPPLSARWVPMCASR